MKKYRLKNYGLKICDLIKEKEKRKRRWKYLLPVLGISAVLAAGCGQTENTATVDPLVLTFAGGPENSLTYSAAIAVAGIVNNIGQEIHAVLEPSKGPMINAVNLSEDDVDLALITGDVAYDAVHGEDSFEGKKMGNLRVIGACYQEVSCWMALEKSGMTHVNQLKGKVISSGSKASVTELTSEMVYDVLGIDVTNTNTFNDSLANSVERLKNDKADAVHGFTELPCYVHGPLAESYETVVLTYTEEELDQIIGENQRYFKTVIPAGTYQGQDEDIPTFGMKMLLCANEDMDADLAYEIARVMVEKGENFAGGHKFMSAMLEGEFLCNDLPIELHEGAKKYYQEAGLLAE